MSPRLHSWKDLFSSKGYLTSLRGGMRYLFGKRGQRLVRGMRLYYRLRLLLVVRSGNSIERLARRREVRLWTDGEECFERLEKILRRANHSIVIQMFIWRDDGTGRKIAHILTEAANRGVIVDITKEAVGDFFEFRGDFLHTKGSQEPVWKAFWNHPRIRITYSTNNDHTKVFAIDGHTLLLTGMNIADEYRYRWHDHMVELHGTEFVEGFLLRKTMQKAGDGVQLVMNADDRKEIRPVLMNILKNAKESVVVEHCYLSDEDVVQAFIDLSKRRVRVTIILPSEMDFHHHSNMLAVGRLLSEGRASSMRVFIYPGSFHAKAILVDYSIGFIGSANLFKGSLDEMGELNVLITGKRSALRKLREGLRKDVLKSRAISSSPSSLWLSRWLAWLGL